MVQHLDIPKCQERRDVVVGHIRIGRQTDQRPWRDETRSRAPHSWFHQGLADSLGRVPTDELAKVSHGFVKVTCSVTFVVSWRPASEKQINLQGQCPHHRRMSSLDKSRAKRPTAILL